jgi:uncharacterized protein
MKELHMAAYIFLWIGGINWGLLGLFNFNLVTTVFGGLPMIVSLIYILVGASAVYTFATHQSYCKVCGMPETKKRK